MKGISYVINGNRFLLLKDEDNLQKMEMELDNLKNRDLCMAFLFKNPFFRGFDTKKLYSELSEIHDVDIKNFSFSTGEPRVEVSYLEHPIKENLFIPVDNYNKYIQNERKWDLINLLRSKGVSKITFSRTYDIDEKYKIKLLNYSIESGLIEAYTEDDVYTFDNQSTTNDYKSLWINNEPEWEGIIKAIENGLSEGCMNFTTDIRGLSLMKFDDNLQVYKNVKVTVSKITIKI